MTKEGEPKENVEDRWPIGRSIVEHIRADVNEEMSPLAVDEWEDAFSQIYLQEREGSIPDELMDKDLIAGIHSMYYAVLDAICVELRQRSEDTEPMNIVIDPSYDDATLFVVHTQEKVLLSGGLKAWHFYWDTEGEMAKEMEDWYQRAASRLAPAREAQPNVEGRYRVTLNLERVFEVDAANPRDALEEAVRWESNENDPAVQLDYEEVVGHDVEFQPEVLLRPQHGGEPAP